MEALGENGRSSLTIVQGQNDGSQPSSIDEHTSFETRKPFTTLSAIGTGYGATNTAVGLLLVLGSTVPMGGSPLFFWGFLLMIFVAWATATSLAELASAMPHPGGQYIWVNQLAPTSTRRALSYCTAISSWLGAVATGASACLSASTGICAIIRFLNPAFVYRRWMGFVAFQVLNLITLFCSCFERALPHISRAVLFVSVTSAAVVFLALFATSRRQHASPKDFFLTPVNSSGWPDGIAFLTGISGINWSLSCLDVVTHLAEEIPSPSTNIPKALMWSVVVGFISGALVITSVFVNVPAINAADDNSALVLFYRISGSKAIAVGIWIPILIATVGALWSIQIWQSRLSWTISRERGFPLYRYLRRIAPAPFYTPVWSLVWSAAFTAAFGCLYLGSELAFNSLISTGLLLQYISYSIPVVLMLIQGRSKFRHGPFWYPRLGLIANLVMLSWTAVAIVFYCFPYQRTAGADAMNYLSVVLIVLGAFTCILWFTFGNRNYQVRYFLRK
ncbi:choline transport protein [Metarhizium rileyi]|uniref:Choline transport protein n=1 Tax=Metarhizium rileyi (strain RCEF 4871) TaxID=1649241 RepID=A0A167EMM6_METRR|nr:choline transport protein [Metarhizium rileyi RCEF 4871]